MLTRIEFDTYNNYNNGHVNKIQKDIDVNTLKIEEVKFTEYQRIDIALISDYEEAYIEICSIEDEDKEEENIIIRNNETRTICKYDRDKNKMVPGYYSYNLYLKNRKVEGSYFIEPSTLEWKNLMNLRQYVNTYINGLAQNMYAQRKVDKIKDDSLISHNIYNMYLYIKSNETAIINNVSRILDNPISDIKKEYKERPDQKNMDSKSQRWLTTKGISKNTNIHRPEIVYSKHSVLNINIPENKRIKKIIKEYIHCIIIIENAYNQKIRNLKDQIMKKKQSKENLYWERSELHKKNINKRRITEIGYELKYFNEDIVIIKDKKKIINENLLDIRKIKSLLIYSLNKSWIKEIDNEKRIMKPTRGIFKDSRYYKLYKIYKDIKNIDKIDSKVNKINFPYKDTPTLFEYYSVLMSIEILNDIGFRWDKGWLADDIEMEYQSGIIPKSEPFIFVNEKNNLRIELLYEKEISSYDNVSKSGKSGFSRNDSPHYKPDIIMAIFNNTKNKYKTSIIIEVKCTKSRYLNISTTPSRIRNQVKGYYGFCYYDMNEKIDTERYKRGAISKVIVLYPNQSSKAIYDKLGMDLKLIQIEASEKEDIKKHVGYDKLKSEIVEVINKIN